MIVGINSVLDWLSSTIYTITHLQIPTGINNGTMAYGVIIIFMFLIRLSYLIIKMFLSKDHNKIKKSYGKD